MKVKAIKTRVFKEGENLCKFITEHIPKLPENSILAVTSKIVALSENRTAVIKNSKTKEKLIKRESTWAAETKHAWLTLKDGLIMPAAGIDESNANGMLVLLPKDSFLSAKRLHKKLKVFYGVSRLGVVITDSRIYPMRAGVVGVALGYFGFEGLKDYRGKEDIFGKIMRVTTTNIADCVATTAVLVMGEGNEQQPLGVIRGLNVDFIEKIDRNELLISREDDLYGPVLNLSKEFDIKSKFHYT